LTKLRNHNNFLDKAHANDEFNECLDDLNDNEHPLAQQQELRKRKQNKLDALSNQHELVESELLIRRYSESLS
jgi:hypothetical protein